MVNKGKCFSITLAIKNLGGFESGSKLEKEILKVIERADYYHAVAETKFNQPDSRHIHAQVFYTNEKSKYDIKKNYLRVMRKYCTGWDEKSMNPPQHNKEKSGGAINIDFSYNDWYLHYTSNNEDKTNDTSELLFNNVPANYGIDNEDFYPSEEDQENFKNKANAVDKKFYRWEELWNEYENKVDNPTLVDIGMFLGDMMFKSRKIQVIIDAKARQQNCKCLLAYIQKSKSLRLFLTGEEYEIYMKEKELMLQGNL